MYMQPVPYQDDTYKVAVLIGVRKSSENNIIL